MNAIHSPAIVRIPMSRRKLEGRAQELFDFIVQHKIANDGQSPTIREMRDETDITSTSVVNYYLDTLVDHGLIRRVDKESRGIQVIGGKWTYHDPGTPESVIRSLDGTGHKTL